MEIDIPWPLLSVILVVVVLLVALALLRFYAYISCGYFKGNERLEGKSVIITGGNVGIGKETAREIARRGARVILACRNLQSARQAKDEIIECTKNDNIIIKKLDLCSQKSIREFAQDVINTEPRLDVLIHNAGIGESKFKKTEDDLEVTMATNYFGPFLLTHLLIDLMKQSAPSRIIVLSSVIYQLAFFNINKINPSSAWWPRYYFVSKYAGICFTLELARRLKGTKVTANCLHPGLVYTKIWDALLFLYPLSYPLKLIMKAFFKDTVQGCQTTVFLACAKEVETVSGKYFVDCAERGLWCGVKNKSKGKELWELTEKLVKLEDTDPKI
ncbi:hypothetical protein NQ315_003748 [Exocentrus adspersus]|uniref:Retinol dehydrogenase 14 n=1 Tax=Exocentrus adspersus TaxID=1586481 RepID=A0AAV8VI27_9CUCU|nr:hypothetical protein NQ315_003748 [Exocentrus adspersus]